MKNIKLMLILISVALIISSCSKNPENGQTEKINGTDNNADTKAIELDTSDEAEITTEEKTEKYTENSTDYTDDTDDADNADEKHTDKSAENSMEKSTEKSTENETEKSTEKVKDTEKSTEKAKDTEMEKSTEKAKDTETEKSTENVKDTETEKSTEKAEETTQKESETEEQSADEPENLKWEVFYALSPEEKDEYLHSYSDYEAFYNWLVEAQATFKKEYPDIEIGADGSIDLSKLIEKNG